MALRDVGLMRFTAGLDVGQFFKFVLVGFVNTLFGLMFYWLLLWTGMHYTLAAALSLIAGILFSFTSHSRIVFKGQGKLLWYAGTWVIIYFVNIFMIAVMRAFTGDYFAAIFLLPINVTLNYFLCRRFVFR